ncbi:hypothetical protein D918_00828 [Trichuris suis]|nr:hypothetical protein D918_00828 [Trichuris suis]
MQSRPSNGRQSINLVRAWSRLTPLETPLNPDQLMNISRHPITLETEDCALSPSVDLTMQSCCLGLSRSYSSEHTMLRAGFRGSTPSRVVRGGSKRQIRLPRTHSPFPDNLQLMVAHHSFASERIDLLKFGKSCPKDMKHKPKFGVEVLANVCPDDEEVFAQPFRWGQYTAAVDTESERNKIARRDHT